MDRNPALQVRMFLNLHRPPPPYQVQRVVRDFVRTFRQQLWPGQRLPEVFYYPPSLDPKGGARSCLHAKCLIVDDLRLLVTSANFTEAAQERNLEAGVVMTDAIAAKAMRRQFEGMIAQKVLERIL
jgi:phosphatidylserine/phosphatidylglycerophosphate/cardiolipin synthase-like enzyme